MAIAFRAPAVRRFVMAAILLAAGVVCSLLLAGYLRAAPAPAADPCGAQFPAPNTQTTVTHEGDLVLAGNESLTIEDQKYVVTGNVYLSGNGRLTVRNSEVEVQHYPRQEIFVSGQATLEAENTIFSGFIHSAFSDQAVLTMNRVFFINLIDLNGQAQATIRNSCLFQDRFGLLQVSGEAQATLDDSLVGAVGLDVPAGFPLAIDGLAPGYFEHWAAQQDISPNLTYDVVLNRSEIKENPGYSGGFEMGWNIFTVSDADLSISDSVLNKLVINFANEDVQFSGLVRESPVDFDYESIHLSDTEVQGQWGIFVSNGETRIDNSDGVWLWPQGSKDTFITNTAINEFDPRQYTGTIHLTDSSMTDGFEIFDSSVFRLEGSVNMLEISPLFTSDSVMTRNFELVVANGRDGAPFADLDLSLTKDGAAVWSGRTDSGGRAVFDITFDIDNYDDAWTLSTADPSISLSKAISISTDAPVMISLEPGADGLLWPVAYADCNAASSGDGSQANPFARIQEAIDAAAGGGLVRVADGTCHEEVDLRNNITLVGAGADSSTVEGNVFAWDVSDAWVSGFTIVDNDTAGIHCYNSSLTSVNNVIRNQPHNGIHSSNCSLTARNNTLVGNGGNGIFLLDSSQAVIENNIFAANGASGVGGEAGSTAQNDYNDFWQNGGGDYGSEFVRGPNDLAADPLFIGAEDYQLRTGSPAVNAGNPDSSHNDPDGSRNDMGAYGGPYAVAATAPLPAGWHHICYQGPGQPIEQALGDIAEKVLAVYRLNAGQTFDRWFPGRPDVSSISTLAPFEALFALSQEGTAWPVISSNIPPSSVSLVPGWNGVCYAGETKPVDDATAGMAGAFSILYRMGTDQAWERFVPGRPEVSTIAQFGQYDAVLILVTQQGGVTWAFDP